MSDIQEVRTNARDLALSPQMYDVRDEKRRRTLSFTEVLEREDPFEQYAADPFLKNLDAFERQMYFAGIHIRSDPERGIWADKLDRFWNSDKPGTQALLPEFLSRIWKTTPRLVFDEAVKPEGERFYSSSSPVSDVLYPPYIQSVVRQKQIAPAIPLSIMVAMTTPVDSGVYEAFYLTDDSTQRGLVRAGEGAEFSTVKLTGGDHSIKLRKYGRKLLGSYETFRRMRIDRFALHLALLSVQTEVDKVKTAIDVLINGDGNSSTSATNHNLTTMDTAAVAGTPTVKGYLNWKTQWGNPYNANIVLGTSADIVKLLMMNAGTANVMFGQLAGMFGIGGVTPISNQMAGVQVGWDSQCSSSVWLGFDNRFALEMVTEIGASLVETDKIISSQFNEIVFSESVAFCVMDVNAARTLTISA